MYVLELAEPGCEVSTTKSLYCVQTYAHVHSVTVVRVCIRIYILKM